MEFEDAVRIALIILGGIALGIGLLWAIWAVLKLYAWVLRRLSGQRPENRRPRPARHSPIPRAGSKDRKPQQPQLTDGVGAGTARRSSDPDLPPLKIDGPFGNSAADEEIRAVHAAHVRKYYTYDMSLGELARKRLSAGELAGAALTAQEIISTGPRCELLIALAEAAFHAGDPRWLGYAKAAERDAERLEEFLDEWFDQNSRRPLLRWDALDKLCDLYRAGEVPGRAVAAMTKTTLVPMALHVVRMILAGETDPGPLIPEVRLHLENIRAALERGETPAHRYGGGPEDRGSLHAALAETWAAIGDLGEARRELVAIPESDADTRARIEVLLGDERSATRAGTEAPGVEASPPTVTGTGNSIEAQARRWVSIEEMVAAVARGDLSEAERLADLQLDTRKRQEYRRDVARAWLDRGDQRAACRVAERIDVPPLRAAVLREIDRVSKGGKPTSPAGDVVAIVVDNHQPGNPEKQQYVKGFQDNEQAFIWAMRRIRASIERYRKPGLDAEEILTRWRAGGEDVKIGDRFPAKPWLQGWAASPASANDVDHESYTPRLF